MICPVCRRRYQSHQRFLTHVQFHGEVLDCPDCPEKLVLRPISSTAVGYRCTEYPLCQANHAATSRGRPRGVPADRETRRWRTRAHAVLDPLWRSGEMTRPEAYGLLRELLDLGVKDGHVSMLSKSQCQDLVGKIRAGDRGTPARRGTSTVLGATIRERITNDA